MKQFDINFVVELLKKLASVGWSVVYKSTAVQQTQESIC